MTLLPTLGLPTSAMRRGWARSRISGRGARSARAWGQDICRQFASPAPPRNAGNSASSAESRKGLPDSRQPPSTFAIRHLAFRRLAFGLWHFAVWPLAFGLWPLAFGLWPLYVPAPVADAAARSVGGGGSTGSGITDKLR